MPKYIGRTINPEQRLAQHIRTKEGSKKYAWIKSLRNESLKPIMTVIESVSADWEFWEDWYIDYYRFLGFELKNHKGGGIGGSLSQETKDKISAKLKGKKKSEAHRLKSIKNLNQGEPWNKGIKLNESQRIAAVKSLEAYRANGGLANAKTDVNKIKEIKEFLKATKLPIKKIAILFNVTIHIVKDLKRGKTWKNI